MSRSTESFGTRLRRFRRQRKLTQEALGGNRYTGAYVSQLESGRRRPSREAVELFAKRLGVDPEYLRTGRDPMLPVSLAIDVQKARSELYKNSKDARGQLEQLVAEAEREGLAEVQMKALEALGLAHEREGSAQTALELLGEAPSSLDEARARNELARVERILGNRSSARAHLERVFELIPDGDPRARGFASREMGLASDDPRETERFLKDAIDLYRIANDPVETASTFRALGDFYRREGDIEAMAEAYRMGIEAVEVRGY